MRLQTIGFDYRIIGDFIKSADYDLLPRDESAFAQAANEKGIYVNEFDLLSYSGKDGLKNLKRAVCHTNYLVAVCISDQDADGLNELTGYPMPDVFFSCNNSQLISVDICDMNGIFSCLSIEELQKDVAALSFEFSIYQCEKLNEIRRAADLLIPEHAPHYIVYLVAP